MDAAHAAQAAQAAQAVQAAAQQQPRKQGSNEECSQGGLPGEAKAGADFQWCLRPFALHDREDDSEQQKHDRRG